MPVGNCDFISIEKFVYLAKSIFLSFTSGWALVNEQVPCTHKSTVLWKRITGKWLIIAKRKTFTLDHRVSRLQVTKTLGTSETAQIGSCKNWPLVCTALDWINDFKVHNRNRRHFFAALLALNLSVSLYVWTRHRAKISSLLGSIFVFNLRPAVNGSARSERGIRKELDPRHKYQARTVRLADRRPKRTTLPYSGGQQQSCNLVSSGSRVV